MSTEENRSFVKPYAVIDDRLAVSDVLDFGVMKGAQELTVQRFPANSASSSSHVYNVQCPSRSTVISREIIWHSKVTLTLTAPKIDPQYVGPNKHLVAVGSTDALGPFPLASLCSTIQATINSNTVSVQMQDVLPQLLRLNNKNDLLAYNGSTPTAYDTFFDYAGSSKYISNPNGGVDNSPDEDINYRGSYPVTIIPGVAPFQNGPIPTPPAPNTAYSEQITFEVYEPLLLSPFMFGQPQNRSGMYGVNNMSFQMNFGNKNRVWRHAAMNTGNPTTDRSWDIVVSDISFADSELIFNFMTPPNSMVLPKRCVVPYYNLNRMLLSTNSATVGPGVKTVIESNAVTIEQIPDKFIICVRKPMSTQTCMDSDSFLPVTALTLTFNNKAGYCSGWKNVDFYRSARNAGSNQSWLEFQGSANAATTDPIAGVNVIKTSGSLIVLDLARDITLSEEHLSSSVGGSYNLQFQIEVTNPYTYAVAPEIVLISVNSGVFKLEDGSSELKTAVLLPSEVAAAKKETPVVHANIRRMLGSGFVDSLRHAWKKSAPMVKHGVSVADALTADGLSASGLSGAAIRHHKSLKDRLK